MMVEEVVVDVFNLLKIKNWESDSILMGDTFCANVFFNNLGKINVWGVKYNEWNYKDTGY